MRVLFLDVDGVLVTAKSMRNEVETISVNDQLFSKSSVELLKEIVDKYNFKIVLSSYWRQNSLDFKTLEELLAMYRMEIHSKTPTTWSNHNARQKEIEAWLSDNPQVVHYIIIDDDAVVENHPRLVQTSWNDGLTRAHLTRLDKIMKDTNA